VIEGRARLFDGKSHESFVGRRVGHRVRATRGCDAT
jgi:hypothetical protein